MKQWLHDHKASAILMGLYLFATISYGLLNQPIGTVHSLKISWDDSVPFIPAFVVIYHTWYPFILWLTYLVFRKDEHRFQRLMVHLLVGQVMALTTFVLFQTEVSRMVVPGHDAFSQLVKLTYVLDNPFNGFPSIHVLASIVVTWHYVKAYSTEWKSSLLASIYAGLIILSTVLIRQHVLLDAVGALVYAIIAGGIGWWIRPTLRTWRRALE